MMTQGTRQYMAATQQLVRSIVQKPRPVLPVAVKSVEPEFTPTEGKEHLEELSCPVCFTLMTNPRFLECGHTLCQGCLGKSSEQCVMCRKKRPRVRIEPSNLEKSILDKVKGDCGSCKRQKISLLEWNRHYTQECSSAAKICNNDGCGEKLTMTQEEHDKVCKHLAHCTYFKRCNWRGKSLADHLANECEHHKIAKKIVEYKTRARDLVNDITFITQSQITLNKAASIIIGNYCFKYELDPMFEPVRNHVTVSTSPPSDPEMKRFSGTSIPTLFHSKMVVLDNHRIYGLNETLFVLVLDQDQLKEFLTGTRERPPDFILYYKPV